MTVSYVMVTSPGDASVTILLTECSNCETMLHVAADIDGSWLAPLLGDVHFGRPGLFRARSSHIKTDDGNCAIEFGFRLFCITQLHC